MLFLSDCAIGLYISADIHQFSFQLLDELVAYLFKNKNNPRSDFNGFSLSSTFDSLKISVWAVSNVLNSSEPSVINKVCVCSK